MKRSDDPLLAVLGITASAATGRAGPTTSLAVYHWLSSQFIQDSTGGSDHPNPLGQRNSLAAIVLQDQLGLDLLTAKRDGLYLFLGEERCF